LEYFAFGETFVEEQGNTDKLPYKFNGKELDEETGLYYYGARYYDAKSSIWLSVDPLMEKYPNQTPYSYVGNKPTNVIDPDGRDEYELNGKGKVVNRIENKEKDSFHIIDKDGKRVANSKDYKSGTVTALRKPKDSKGKEMTLFEISGDKEASEIFEFFGDNYTKKRDRSNEWLHAKVGTQNSEKNIIGTNHSPTNATEIAGHLFNNGYTLKEVNHNHPAGSGPSGLPAQSGRPATNDIRGAELIQSKFPDAKLNVYRSRIDYPEKGGYHPYDNHGAVPYEFLKKQ